MIISYCDLNIFFSKHVISIFKDYIQNDINKPESGGILTGKIYENLVEVLNCSTPGALDKQSRYNFSRSYKSAQLFINDQFDKSKGEEIYLGEWHTHPENIPKPSCVDINSFEKTLNNNKLNSHIHFMIIIGINNIYIGGYIDKNIAFEINNTIP